MYLEQMANSGGRKKQARQAIEEEEDDEDMELESDEDY